MANATSRVAKTYRDYRNDTVRHSWGTISSSLQLYTGAMVGLKADGYLAKFDDTQSLRFYGIVLDVENYGGRQGPKLPRGGLESGVAGDGTLDVEVKQPKRLEVTVASVVIADIGRPVYALDDQTGTFDASATTYGNQIGVVADLVYGTSNGSPVSNIALVTPTYDPPNGSRVATYGATGALAIRDGLSVITKAGVAVMTLADPTAGIHDGVTMRIQSATAFAHTVSNAAGSGFNAGGAGTDVGTWGGAIGDGMEITAYSGKWWVNYLRNVTLA